MTKRITRCLAVAGIALMLFLAFHKGQAVAGEGEVTAVEDGAVTSVSGDKISRLVFTAVGNSASSGLVIPERILGRYDVSSSNLDHTTHTTSFQNYIHASRTGDGILPICRLGVGGGTRSLGDYPEDMLASLRLSWYFNWGVSSSPYLPDGMQYAPSIIVKQWKWDDGLVLYSADAPYAEPYTYTIKPSIAQIKNVAENHPGYLWLVGNEIERRDWLTSDGNSWGQQEILPEVYAQAYHEIYSAIKSVDPTAKVANGSIIVPTTLRLEYMSRVWDEYYNLYGVPMPVDVWQIHVYLGPEKRNSWGIDIPAGIDDVEEGMFYWGEGDPRNVLVNKDFSYVPGLIRDFRTWMKERGQQDKPLIITELGVSMPDWVMEGEFTPESIRDEYMYPSLDFILEETDPDLGYPADDYRLVQSVWWWSLDIDAGGYEGETFYQDFNGNLLWSGLGAPTHSPNPVGITQLGEYWSNYVSTLAEEMNLRPLALSVSPTPYSEDGEPVTMTLHVELSNSGNIAITEPFTVLLEVEETSEQIASFLVDGLLGCGAIYEQDVVWSNVAPGSHVVRMVVDVSSQITETSESDNDANFSVLVATHRVNLPFVSKLD